MEDHKLTCVWRVKILLWVEENDADFYYFSFLCDSWQLFLEMFCNNSFVLWSMRRTLTKKYFPELDLHCVSCRILLIVFFQCAVVEWLNCVLCERGCRVMISCSLSGLFRVQLEHKISKFVYNYCLLCDWLRMKLLYRIREPLGTQSPKPFQALFCPKTFF